MRVSRPKSSPVYECKDGHRSRKTTSYCTLYNLNLFAHQAQRQQLSNQGWWRSVAVYPYAVRHSPPLGGTKYAGSFYQGHQKGAQGSITKDSSDTPWCVRPQQPMTSMWGTQSILRPIGFVSRDVLGWRELTWTGPAVVNRANRWRRPGAAIICTLKLRAH